MRRLAVLITLIGGLAVAPAVAAPTLPSVLAKQIRAINAAAKAPPVLLPTSMPLDAAHLYPSGGPDGATYDIPVGAVRRCNDADACFVADFSAIRGTRASGQRVTVKGASSAGFRPLSCGASCSPPSIEFVVKGIRYAIQANLKKTAKGDKATLVAAAQSAIDAGPRSGGATEQWRSGSGRWRRV